MLVVTQRLPDGPEQELSFQMLSDGYRTMLALVMDFARRMAQANPHLDKPLEAEAILLVDEIDLHLHPLWQQTVVPAFRRAFPNTQLIFTTHSPQVLTTVPAEKILLVERDGIRPCPAPTYGARSSDVVEEVLGLRSLRPPDNEVAQKISALFQALDNGRLEEAKTLRADLESWAKGFPEPDLVRADLLIRRLEYQKQQPSPAA
jgi:predicted ATP-binding protein involved in virulence